MSSPLRTFMAAAGALMATGALCASAASAAPVLYGATGVTATDTLPASNLYTINPDTGATTSVGSIGKAVTGLAFDGTDGTLYGVTAGVQLAGTTRDLLKINPATGASTVVGSMGVNEIEDIAVSPLGQLYGWNETGDDLYSISKATGAVTKVGEAGLGVTFGNGISFDRNGAFWGMLDGDFGHVFKIDPTTGAVTTTTTRLTNSPIKSGTQISSLDTACDGLTMYGVVNDFGGATNLVTIDLATGVITNKGASLTALDAIAWGGCPPPPQSTPGGTVPATLSLSLGAPVTFGAFTPGLGKTYLASTTANVISTAGDALLSVADPSSVATGHLVNGTFVMPETLQARARNAANTGTAYNNVGSSASPLNLLTYSGPISNDTVTLEFSQLVKATDALRTGAYSKTLTYTLSTTTP
ncbi:hypothetical protein OM076_08275 [Solirubrobacter ginsenosidimutans]|uniref:DUF4394 domain-containing protein n=1 Tax=Solirubrobacter ginsenosidimutans TaxID=490573 RepID=A0A9X3MQY9_9ACTN|nr:hypothetical protein [Solirubrobacter ginsenosidimutans]MDA0160256.1 hypothetical protein [Solirubrobacter ginsenosidimutans]